MGRFGRLLLVVVSVVFLAVFAGGILRAGYGDLDNPPGDAEYVDVRLIQPSWSSHGPRAWMGIWSESDGVSARVYKIIEGGPAWQAGIRVGDRITSIHARNLPLMPSQVKLYCQPGEAVVVVYKTNRGSWLKPSWQTRTTTMILGAWPED